MMFQVNESGVQGDAGSTSYGPDTFNAAKVVEDIWNKPSAILTTLLTELNDAIGPGALGKALVDLDTKSAALVQVLGVGGQRGAELTNTIARAIPQFLELGLKAEDVTKNYTDLINKFNVNMSLTDQQLVELAATAKVTGQKGEELAKSFQDVGLPLSMVADKMMSVTVEANKAGVTVGSVSAGVVKNLDKMNLYNFEGGVDGLAKMAVQASRLGINMDNIFKVVEDVFNPEGAIELAASLQRLGVQTSEMLDPLRLMDLAQNDPAELQNQIVGMTKQFTRFNEETKQFEILPGAKRQMAEVAGALGMTGGEFQKMALNAANFDTKLKQIKFSPDVKEEDRELVATMAQINKDGVAQVKVKTVDETGKLTGEEKMVDVGLLTAEQIEDLKQQQILEGESMEKIAINQLSELARLNGAVDRLTTTLTYGVTSRKDSQGVYKASTQGLTGVVEKAKGLTVEGVQNYDMETLKKDLTILFSDMDSSAMTLVNTLGDGFKSIYNGGLDFLKDAKDYVSNFFTFDAATTSATTEKVNTAISNATNVAATTIPTSTPSIPESITLNHIFDFKNVPQNMTSTEVTTIMKDWATNAQNAYTIVAAAGKVNTGLT